MNNEDFERKIEQSFDSITPDIYDSIKEDCKDNKSEVISMNKANKIKLWAKKWAALVAVFALVLTATFANGFYDVVKAEETRVTLDVNPSIEISLNKNDRVLDVKPLNDDGRVILGEMDLKNADLDVAVNALLGSMFKNGYLNDMANSILVSVDGQSTEKAGQVQNDVSSQIDNYMKTNNVDGAILSQNITNNSQEIKDFAQKYDISEGKAQCILQFVSEHPNFNAEDLVDLSINEINVLMQNANNGSSANGNVSSSGTASEKAYIGKQKATAIALRHAGFSENEVKELEAEFDIDKVNGETVMVYEVDFHANNTKYDYDIDAVTGEIIKSKNKPMSQKEIEEELRDEQDIDDDDLDDKKDQVDHDDDHDDDDDDDDRYDQNSNANKHDDDKIEPQDNYISESKAKSIALKNAGFSEGEVQKLKAKLDRSKGVVYYEVEFDKDNMEYEYKLDPVSGSIVNHKVEPDT